MSLRILHYSDLEKLYDSPERTGRLAGLIAACRTEDTIVVGTGDNTAPSALSIVTNGRQALDLFTRIDPDADTFGNHDFDSGIEAIRAIVRDSPQTWLNSNLVRNGAPFANEDGAVPWTVVTVENARVGIIGVASPETPVMNYKAGALSVTDPVTTVEELAETLRTDHDADYIVVLSHLGNESRFADALSVPVDAILGGHSHTVLADYIAGDGNGTVVTRPGANGERVLEVILDNSLDTPEIISYEAQKAPIDEDVRDAIRQRIDDSGLEEVVATVSDPLLLTKETASCGESRVGNFVTDAYRWATESDVAILGASAIREGDPLVGEVTVFDLINAVPFDDPLIVLELAGSELLDTFRELDHGKHARTCRDWYFGHVSGAHLTWDADGKLRKASIDGGQRNGMVAEEDVYTLSTSAYYVVTDHIFSAFDDSHVLTRADPQYEAIIEYARCVGITPEIEERIVRKDLHEQSEHER